MRALAASALFFGAMLAATSASATVYVPGTTRTASTFGRTSWIRRIRRMAARCSCRPMRRPPKPRKKRRVRSCSSRRPCRRNASRSLPPEGRPRARPSFPLGIARTGLPLRTGPALPPPAAFGRHREGARAPVAMGNRRRGLPRPPGFRPRAGCWAPPNDSRARPPRSFQAARERGSGQAARERGSGAGHELARPAGRRAGSPCGSSGFRTRGGSWAPRA